MSTSPQKKSNKFITGVLIGSAVGAAIGMALAPQPGEVTRQKIKEGIKKATNIGKKVIDENKDIVVGSMKVAAKESSSFIGKLITSIKTSVKESLEEIPSKKEN